MLAVSKGSTASTIRKPDSSRQDTLVLGKVMAPAYLDSVKKNEVIMTKEEAKKRRLPKGYAYVPISSQEILPHVEPAGIADNKLFQTDHSGASETTSGSHGSYNISGKHTYLSAKSFVEEGRGEKRKLETFVNHCEPNVTDLDSADHVMTGKLNGNSKHSDSSKIALSRSETKRRRLMLLEQLRRLDTMCSRIEARELHLRSLATATAGESAGDNVRKMAPALDTSYATHHVSGKSMADETDAVHSGKPKMIRQASQQFSDATPGVSGKEKRTPKANTAYINQDFVSGKDRLPPPEKVKPFAGKSGPGVKRGLQLKSGEVRSLKRQRIEASRVRRSKDIMKMCSSVLKKLLIHKWAWVFDKPVDVVALNLPDYFSVIKQPMDLGTVDKRLKAEEYGTASEFAADVRLVFSNAMTYNPPKTDVHIMADEMRKLFDLGFQKVEERLREEEKKWVEEEEELVVDVKEQEREVEELHRRLQRLESQVEMKDRKGGAGGSSRSSFKGGPLPRPRRDDTEKRAMNFEEKRKLSVNLGKLPGDKLGRIVQIISSHQPELTQEDDEIELDIDSLDNETLWELERYVANVMKSKNKQRKRVTEEVEKTGATQFERLSEAGGDSSSKRREEGDDDEVDVGDNQPTASHAEGSRSGREQQGRKSSSSGSSSSDDSGSSSSGSESGSGSSGSDDSENDDAQSKEATSRASPEKKGPVGFDAGQEGGKKKKRGSGPPPDSANNQQMRSEEESKFSPPESKPSPKSSNDEVASSPTGLTPTASAVEGNTGKAEQQTSIVAPMTDEAAVRAALLRGRYADSILNAQKKAGLGTYKNERLDPKRVEEMERKQREERARLAKEAQAAEEARRRQEEVMQAELRRKREQEREAARRALVEMERTVRVDENSEILSDIHDSSVVPPFPRLPAPEVRSSDRAHHALPTSFTPGGISSSVLEGLGLYMREDHDDGDDITENTGQHTDSIATMEEGDEHEELGVVSQIRNHTTQESLQSHMEVEGVEEGEIGSDAEEDV